MHFCHHDKQLFPLKYTKIVFEFIFYRRKCVS